MLHSAIPGKLFPYALYEGSTGPAVRVLQQKLKERLFNPSGIEVNGTYDKATCAGVEEFQRATSEPRSGWQFGNNEHIKWKRCYGEDLRELPEDRSGEPSVFADHPESNEGCAFA